MPDPGDPTRTEGEGATVDLPGGVGGIAPGQVLGERYQVLELLGRGGMGEVWHAFDLKLRVGINTGEVVIDDADDLPDVLMLLDDVGHGGW